MHRILRILAISLFVLAAVLALLALTSFPAKGLIFALLYVFLLPAIVLGVAGGLVRLLSRPLVPRDD